MHLSDDCSILLCFELEQVTLFHRFLLAPHNVAARWGFLRDSAIIVSTSFRLLSPVKKCGTFTELNDSFQDFHHGTFLVEILVESPEEIPHFSTSVLKARNVQSTAGSFTGAHCDVLNLISLLLQFSKSYDIAAK